MRSREERWNMNVEPEVMRQVQEGANQNNVTAAGKMLGRRNYVA